MCLISAHLFLHKCTREEHLHVSTVQTEPVTVTHSSLHPLFPFHSVKTDVHNDRPFLHLSGREEEDNTVLPLPCLHLSTQPKQKYLDRPNNVSFSGSQHPHPPRAMAQFSSPTGVQQPWVITKLKDGNGFYPNMCCCYTSLRWYLMLLLELVQGSSCMLADS